MSNKPVDQSRRTWVTMACAAGGVGGVATAIPFVSTFQPSERARAAGAAVEADISALKPGEMMTVEWRGKPVWIMRRTPEQLAALAKIEGQLTDPKSELKPEECPEYARNAHRSIKPEYLVTVGICTHLGCTVQYREDKDAIWCACHGGQYDAHTGKNVAGPPPKPLTPLKVEVSGDKIIVSLA